MQELHELVRSAEQAKVVVLLTWKAGFVAGLLIAAVVLWVRTRWEESLRSWHREEEEVGAHGTALTSDRLRAIEVEYRSTCTSWSQTR
jgi:hypothetical protein